MVSQPAAVDAALAVFIPQGPIQDHHALGADWLLSTKGRDGATYNDVDITAVGARLRQGQLLPPSQMGLIILILSRATDPASILSPSRVRSISAPLILTQLSLPRSPHPLRSKDSANTLQWYIWVRFSHFDYRFSRHIHNINDFNPMPEKPIVVFQLVHHLETLSTLPALISRMSTSTYPGVVPQIHVSQILLQWCAYMSTAVLMSPLIIGGLQNAAWN